MDDFMEIGDSDIVSTRYGFMNKETGQYYDDQMNEINEARLVEILDEIEDTEL